jgi:hypothetical protein
MLRCLKIINTAIATRDTTSRSTNEITSFLTECTKQVLSRISNLSQLKRPLPFRISLKIPSGLSIITGRRLGRADNSRQTGEVKISTRVQYFKERSSAK